MVVNLLLSRWVSRVPSLNHVLNTNDARIGAFVGFVGIMAVVGENVWGNDTLVWITVGFGVAAGLVALVAACAACPSRGSGDMKGRAWASGITFSAAVTTITVLFAFYSDWALAAVSGNLVGTPTKHNAVLYYFFWVAKRLPMLSLCVRI